MYLPYILIFVLFLSSTYSLSTENRSPKFLLNLIHSNPELLSKSLPENNGINSPIYYIKMPPIPYTFIPGLGYVSNPQAPHNPDLVNLPLPFLGNGRPVTIYRWSQVPLINTVPNHEDSDIHKLEGDFVFNGKPNKNVFILKKDFENNLYEDVLNHIYP